MDPPDIDIEVYTICNDLNYHKYTKLINETCTKVMYIAYQLLYDWSDRTYQTLVDHLDETPFNHNKPLRNLLTKAEIQKITIMSMDKDKMRGYDITFFYKLIQYAINNDKIVPLNDCIWSRICPINQEHELEHLLFLLKESRNEFSHRDSQFFDLNEEDIENVCGTLCKRFRLIMEQIGLRTPRIDQRTIDEICIQLTRDVEKIQNMEEFSLDEKERLLKITFRNDLIPYLELVQPLLKDDLINYCPPTLKFEEEIITTEQLFSLDYQLICITAEATAGKTSISKYMQHKLLLKIEIPDVDITSLEIPLRVICREINEENFFMEFLKRMIPIFQYHVSDDHDNQHLRKFLKRFNIRWIIDGYDEKTDKFSGFFQTLLNVLPKNHKIIITSRPECLAELRDEADELNYRGICNVTIECFSVKQIKEVAEKYLGVDRAKDFHRSMENLKLSLLENLVTPDDLIAYLEFWSINPTRYDGSEMTAIKFKFINKERQRNLLKKQGQL